MRTLTVRLPESVVVEIEAEARARKLSTSDVVRERLSSGNGEQRTRAATLAAIDDLIGSADGLPEDLSSAKKRHPEASGYGRKRRR